MKILNLTKQFAALAIVASLFTACDKVKEVDRIGDRGQTVVKIIEGGSFEEAGVNGFAIDFVPVPITIDLVDIRRDVPNNEELNKTMTVTISDDTAALRYYNDSILVAGGAAPAVYFPNAWYTLGSGVVKTGGDGGSFTVTFQPGEFAKQISITIPDATLLDPSTSYALPFTITTADANGVISSSRTVIATIGAKNAYDGRYELTFSNYHPTSNPGYTGDVVEVELHTTGAYSNKIFFPAIGGYYNPAILGGTLTAFAAQEPEYTFDPVTNKVTVQNSYAGAATFYTMNPSFNSYYDPATRTIYAKWGYNYVGGTFSAATSREWTQEFRYLGPR